MTVTKLEEEKEGYQQAIQLLGDLLAQTKGLSNKLDTDITAAYKTVDSDYYGAFQNFKYTSDLARAASPTTATTSSACCSTPSTSWKTVFLTTPSPTTARITPSLRLLARYLSQVVLTPEY